MKNTVKHYKKAFSTVELLVVMVVFAVLAGLGISSVSSFRIGSELSSSVREVDDLIRTTRNYARNNYISDTITRDSTTLDQEDIFNYAVEGYIVSVDDEGKVYTQVCIPTAIVGEFDCASNNREPIELNVNSNENIDVTINNCEGIFYERSSADMRTINDGVGTESWASIDKSDNMSDSISCSITITHQRRENSPRNFEFNPLGDNYSISTGALNP